MTHKKAMKFVLGELERVRKSKKPFNSCHEAYGILLEEVDELWDEVKKKGGIRSKKLMRDEAKQVATAAIRFMEDLC